MLDESDGRPAQSEESCRERSERARARLGCDVKQLEGKYNVMPRMSRTPGGPRVRGSTYRVADRQADALRRAAVAAATATAALVHAVRFE